jgi:hypothetical protein
MKYSLLVQKNEFYDVTIRVAFPEGVTEITPENFSWIERINPRIPSHAYSGSPDMIEWTEKMVFFYFHSSGDGGGHMIRQQFAQDPSFQLMLMEWQNLWYEERSRKIKYEPAATKTSPGLSFPVMIGFPYMEDPRIHD